MSSPNGKSFNGTENVVVNHDISRFPVPFLLPPQNFPTTKWGQFNNNFFVKNDPSRSNTTSLVASSLSCTLHLRLEHPISYSTISICTLSLLQQVCILPAVDVDPSFRPSMLILDSLSSLGKDEVDVQFINELSGLVNSDKNIFVVIWHGTRILRTDFAVLSKRRRNRSRQRIVKQDQPR